MNPENSRPREIIITLDRYDALLTEAMDAARIKDIIIERYHRQKGITAEEVKLLYEVYFNLPKFPEDDYTYNVQPVPEGGDTE